MNKIVVSACVLFFARAISLFADPIENGVRDENISAPKTFVMPMLAYTFITLGNIEAHNAVGGLMLYRFNPSDRSRLFSLSLMYSPQVFNGINPDFPDLYHTVTASVMQRINRHTVSGAFVAMTDKPVYGGLRTVTGMAGYSYALVKGTHFSMNLGGYLAFMDVGLILDNGMPWLLWPIPSISFSWVYEWVTVGIIPGLKISVAPKFPIGFMFQASSQKYDASLWFRYFKNGNPSAEILGIGGGIKRESKNVFISDGGKYGISYDAVYGTLRLLRFLEISGGWAFNGQEGYTQVNWEALFESAGYSDDTMYRGTTGDGFFISTSLRIGL
jgi:hypothetical protein